MSPCKIGILKLSWQEEDGDAEINWDDDDELDTIPGKQTGIYNLISVVYPFQFEISGSAS